MSITITIDGVPVPGVTSVSYCDSEPLPLNLGSDVEAIVPRSYSVNFDMRLDRRAWRKFRKALGGMDAREHRRWARVERSRCLGDHRRWRFEATDGPTTWPRAPRMGLR
jgi:hypothetical protein